MVKFNINLNKQGYGSVPKELRDIWGRRLEIIPNNTAGILFKKGTDMKDILISLRILEQDIEHRVEQEEKKIEKRRKVKQGVVARKLEKGTEQNV